LDQAPAEPKTCLRPLEGIRVLDLTRLIPGPFATLVLADLGAQVDKLEDMTGDYLRFMPPLVGDTSSLFLALNRNKRSACIDLKSPTGKAAFLRLVDCYDVVCEPFRPGVMDRLGLGFEALHSRNPRLVFCSLSGYGSSGPLAQRAGHDLTYLARSGLLGMQGPPSAPPQVPGFQVADVGGALWSVVGILAALQERARTGVGRHVGVSLLEASMGFAAAGFGQVQAGFPLGRGDGLLTGGLAVYATYETKDGKYVAFGALEPKFWKSFCEGTDREADMSALTTGPHQAALKNELALVFASRTRAEWEAFARHHDCCLEPVLEPSELAEDEHLSARGVFFDLDSPWGRLPQLRTPLTPAGAQHTPPPRIGEHTDAILREAGFEDDEIAALRAGGAVR
jgi:crotonobetainyl-CoA:carnitine CoA-transferase CaiB-like acyl-CoA transferase